MRRLAAILLVALFLALGSGAVAFVHNAEHLAEQHAHAAAAGDGKHSHERDGHQSPGDETNCFLHSLMHSPTISAGWTPLLICLGSFVAFLTLLASQPAAQKFFTRLDCRGPPARLLIPSM